MSKLLLEDVVVVADNLLLRVVGAKIPLTRKAVHGLIRATTAVFRCIETW